MSESFNRIRLLTFAVVMAVSGARADIIVDNFSTASPTITQTGSGTTTSASLTGSGILGSRTLAVTAASPITSASVEVSGDAAMASFIGDYNSANGANDFSLEENFSSRNATGDGLSELVFDLESSLGTTMTITANGTSTYTFNASANPAGVMETIDFSAFSNPAVFSGLTSLQFVETFPDTGINPSVGLTGPIALAAPVVASSTPEPSSMILALGSIVLVSGRVYFRRRLKPGFEK